MRRRNRQWPANGTATEQAASRDGVEIPGVAGDARRSRGPHRLLRRRPLRRRLRGREDFAAPASEKKFLFSGDIYNIPTYVALCAGGEFVLDLSAIPEVPHVQDIQGSVVCPSATELNFIER